ncbi:CdiA C-terminal domain-containing protein [Actinophytocola gossypii]|uniref:tRNA nuclease CdiA C-terminal domain-containing protein n=1 Tax=Actinophytocola gossypii TaxID=2812003 RepID=A0ABT2JD29_9PSEU|nr:hypothetical protein [Actinophytocola gossypii]MCT2585626.1 hypothetical protein [Actinophytocola gossypii]
MVVAEPADSLGLWARIKPAVGWPDSRADLLGGLEVGWRQGAGHLDAVGDFDTRPVLEAWTDDVGATFHADVTSAGRQIGPMADAMRGMADYAAMFVAEDRNAKVTIADGVHRTLPLYASTYQLPPAIGEQVRTQIATQLAGQLSTVLPAAAQRIRAAAPPEDEWGEFGEELGENLGRWGDFARGLTQPSGAPDENAEPGGTPTTIPPKEMPENKRALELENRTAEILAKDGYDVEQNPPTTSTGKNPDYRVEGKYFDNIAPTTDNVRNIASRIEGKVVAGQADRITLNMTDSNADHGALYQQLRDYPIDGLHEVLMIDEHGDVRRLYP